MPLFWVLTAVTFTIVGAAMFWLYRAAREVPDASEQNPDQRRRMRHDTIRMLAWVVVCLVLLGAATYELFIYYGPE